MEQALAAGQKPSACSKPILHALMPSGVRAANLQITTSIEYNCELQGLSYCVSVAFSTSVTLFFVRSNKRPNCGKQTTPHLRKTSVGDRCGVPGGLHGRLEVLLTCARSACLCSRAAVACWTVALIAVSICSGVARAPQDLVGAVAVHIDVFVDDRCAGAVPHDGYRH